MAKRTNKPTPKSQKEISNDLVQPYVNPETRETLGNPNPSNFDQFNDREQSGVNKNRSENLSFRNDTTKPFTVGIKDIDEAIMYYFTEIIKPTVIQNGNKIKVPIIYGSPERWKSTQIDGYYKDKNGKIMAPLIMFKKESITNDLSKSSKVDANHPHLYASWQKSYSNKNSYSNFNILNNSVPTKQFIANIVPDYVTLTYKCTIQTYYVEQLNKIIEAINYSSNSYWGFPERFKFKSMIDSYAVATELIQGTDRTVKGDFTLKVMGYIVPDTIQKSINSIKKYNSKSQIIITTETTSSL